ncbi:MAG TPA: L-histidine N(alpha)-methyltransferase [Candidatus Saccharimonadales bacterium]|nr:L-histidine N(alpha)-methyltransferase [Candidatus Saccharimonadales bacterium]
MQYFKNVELTKLYPVSESAVRKWIDAARQGKLELQLYEHKGKAHIANTAKNLRLIEELVARGKKYKNTRAHKVVTPKKEFYELYSRKQIFDIISNVEIHHELPLQYSYFDGGVDYWDNYTKRLWNEEGDNTLNATVRLLRSSLGVIDSLIEDYDRVNVIDIGVGNGLPVKELLSHLLYERAALGRYVGIDISAEMLNLARKNINKWFEGRVDFEGYERDITYERFDDLIAKEDPHKAINLVLAVGGTLNNLRSPSDALRTIYNSIGRNDLFITATKLDSEEARRYFDFNAELGMPRLAKNHRILLDLLNIEDSFYDVEQFYDETRRARFIRVKLKVDLTLTIELEGMKRRIELYKGDTLLLWRATHQTDIDIIEQCNQSGLALLQAVITRDRQFFLSISEIDTTSQSAIYLP